MGENEQSGMLRVVVVLGLIAIIAGVLIGGISVLKGKMAEETVNVTKASDMLGDNARANQLLQVGWATADFQQFGNVGNYNRSTWNRYYTGGRTWSTAGHNGDAGVALEKGYTMITSPTLTIPKNAHKLTVNLWTNNRLMVTLFPVYNDEHQAYWHYKDSTDATPQGQWHYYDHTFDLASEGVDLSTIKGVNIQLLNWSLNDTPTTVSNVEITFS